MRTPIFAKSRDFSSPFATFYLVPQLLRHPESFSGTAISEDPFGRTFLELVARTPEKTRKSRLKRIEAALQKAVPQLTGLTDTKDEAGMPHLEATYAHWRPNAGRQREDQFSDGTLRLIGLFWSLLDGDSPLLLEEPELSLHSEIVSKLPGIFLPCSERGNASYSSVLIVGNSCRKRVSEGKKSSCCVPAGRKGRWQK